MFNLVKLSKQLYPTGRAWKMPYLGILDGIHAGLAVSELKAFNDCLSTLDSALPDNENFTEEDASSWERRLGLVVNNDVDLELRKSAIRRKINHPGTIPARQSYLYLEGQLQDAGFSGIKVYENRFPALGSELTNDPTFTTNGIWYDALGVGSYTFNTGLVDVAGLAFSELRTGIILTSGNTYKVSIIVDSLTGVDPVLTVWGGLSVYTISTTGTYEIEITATMDYVRLYSSATSAVISLFSVKETGSFYETKNPLELTGGSGGRQIQHGEVQHGTNQHGTIFSNVVANHIDESIDQTFGIGSNLRSTFFIGADPIGTFYDVPEERKNEFRQLILKVKPVQTVAFLFINYI